MEEKNAVELLDYLSVIWKRKILIIVVILVCIGVGVGLRLKKLASVPPPETTYIADAIIKVGKKVELVLDNRYSSPVVGYIENLKDMEITVPLLYDLEVKGASGYHLDVEPVGALTMLKLTLSGLDEGIERALGELVDKLLDKHRVKVSASLIVYNNFMKRLKADAERLKEEVDRINADVNEMKRREEVYIVRMDSPGVDAIKGVLGADRSAYLNMLYLKTIDRQKDLSTAWRRLRAIHQQTITHQITLGNLEDYRTEIVSGVKSTAIVKPYAQEKGNTIVIAGVAGLIMSLFIAFFWEYIEEAKARRKGKK